MHHHASHADRLASAPGSLRTLMAVAALGTLLVSSWRSCQQTHRRRLADKPGALLTKPQTWDGEGGA